MSEIKQATRDLADRIKKDIKIDPKTGKAEVPADLYVNTLPEGVTKEHVEAIDNHNTLFASAAYLALGEEALPVLKKHKALTEVTVEIPTVGKSSFNGIFERSSQVRAPGATESTTKYGTGSMKLDFYGGAQNRGEFKKVKDFLVDKAAAALAD